MPLFSPSPSSSSSPSFSIHSSSHGFPWRTASPEVPSPPISAEPSSQASQLPWTPQQKSSLSGVVLLLIVGFSAYELFGTTAPLLSRLSAVFITVSALFPSYLWCGRSRAGMPIYPLFSLTFLWTYALPLVTEHKHVLQYSPESHLSASVTVASALCLGTAVWYWLITRRQAISPTYRGIDSRRGNRLFFSVLGIAVFFNIYTLGGWFQISGGAFSIIQGAILGLTALGTFVLGYRLGKRELTRQQTRILFVFLALYFTSSAMTLLLVKSASIFLIATVSFTIGRRKLPMVPVVIFVLCLSFLHSGKADMREKYWNQGHFSQVQPWQYPSRYAEWMTYAIDYKNQKQDGNSTVEKRQSFSERSSLIHMFLLAQDRSPRLVPYMKGETYSILPQMMVPRILNPNKLYSHEGTYRLNIHYGRQTREAALKATIGWGMMAEAYANYGILGCWGLAILLGAVYGKLAQISINKPILSASTLFSVMLMTFAFQTEWSAGVYVAALCQSGLVLSALTIFTMRSHLSEDIIAWIKLQQLLSHPPRKENKNMPLSPEQSKQKCLKLYFQGMGLRDIERTTGIHEVTILQWVREIGERLPEAYYSVEETPVTAPFDQLKTIVGEPEAAPQSVTFLAAHWEQQLHEMFSEEKHPKETQGTHSLDER